jgi:dihydrofolate reductase
MFVSLIVAMDQHGLIGSEAGLPWHLPTDLRRFKEYTWGKPLIMGRRTFESIGKPLPGRLNIILTHRPDYRVPDCQVALTFPEALSLARDYLVGRDKDEAMIIGGGEVYAEAIPHWDRLYLTIVHGLFKGTTYFPVRELLRQYWRRVSEPEMHPADERNRHGHSFHILERAWDTERLFPQPGEVNPPLEGANHNRALEEVDLAAILTGGP